MMAIKTIEVSTINGRQRVWAVVEDGLAVHPTLDDSFMGGYVRRKYTVTHIGTGGYLRQYLSKHQVGDALKMTRKLAWRGMPLTDIPVCEIAQNFNVIYEDIRREPPDLVTRMEVSKLFELNGCGSLPGLDEPAGQPAKDGE